MSRGKIYDKVSEIQKLSEVVINQIAAGEVVERPASVVKELVENSLDAGATQVEAHIREGGRTQVRVIDNGEGLDRHGLIKAIQRHYTSKIKSNEDLFKISSLGFRGEALASIAAVSRFAIASRKRGSQTAWLLDLGVSDKSLSDHYETSRTGMPEGTEVIVRDLFYNIPARRSFLKRDQTEYSYVLSLMQQLAIAHPAVSFSLFHNDKKTFQSYGKGNADEVARTILGSELFENMVAVSHEHPQAQLSGWVGRPGTGTGSRPRQHLFVNRRAIENKLVWSAIHHACSSILGRNERAQYLLLLKLSPHLVDVNVHPQKKEVKFLASDLVFKVVSEAVSSALSGYVSDTWRPASTSTGGRGYEYSSQVPSPRMFSMLRDHGSASQNPARPSRTPGPDLFSAQSIGVDQDQSFSDERAALGQPISELDFGRPVFQLLSLFLVEELDDGVNVYDQHAVHERVLYEKFANAFLDSHQEASVQPLLIPAELDLSPEEMAVWQESKQLLETVGFRIEAIDESRISVKAVPVSVSQNSIAGLVRDYLSDLLEGSEIENSGLKEIDNQTHRRLAYLSCRSAIKAGDRLGPAEARSLLSRFHDSKTPFTCPHGRPVMVQFTRREMEKWFKR